MPSTCILARIFHHAPVEWRCLFSNVGSGYIYTADLQSLDALRPLVKPQLPSQLYRVHTPLKVIAWKQMLTDHQDQRLVSYLVNGVKDGFRIGFEHTRCSTQLRSSGKNMASAKKNPEVVQAYIDSEVDTGRLMPVQDEHPNIHTSSFGVIPKRSQPGKWRLIVNLSSPNGRSVNDGISAALCSLKYPSVHDGARIARLLGRGALLAKLDLKNA